MRWWETGVVLGRSTARTVLVVAALAGGWIGYLSVGSWETDDAGTAAGTILIVGALLAVALVVTSFTRGADSFALWAAAAVSAVSWVLGLLVD
jgi:uncharacterized membrane protein (UPF0136 family)